MASVINLYRGDLAGVVNDILQDTSGGRRARMDDMLRVWSSQYDGPEQTSD